MLSWITPLITVAGCERCFSLLWQWISEMLDLLGTRAEAMSVLSESACRHEDQVTDHRSKFFSSKTKNPAGRPAGPLLYGQFVKSWGKFLGERCLYNAFKTYFIPESCSMFCLLKTKQTNKKKKENDSFLVAGLKYIKWHMSIGAVESRFYFRILFALTHLQCWWIYGKMKLCFYPAVSPMWQ